ncbi:hypothetical protein CANCADRAFT_28186, partial [Tortispora caseinolytica NRRL Y-17796]
EDMDHSSAMHAMHGMAGEVDASGMDMCSMSMTFNWEYKNLCIVFKWWKIRTMQDLVVTCGLIVLLTAFYEKIRNSAVQGRNYAGSPLLTLVRPRSKIYNSLMYTVQVVYSMFIMLIFMTYNGYCIASIAVGAFFGHLVWGNDPARDLNCH